MIRKAISNIKFKKNDLEFVNDIIPQLTELRKCHSIFTLIAQNTGYSWQGVKSAAISLFPDNWIELPHYYSNSLLSESSHIKIGEIIGELRFEQLVFNGFAPYFAVIAKHAKRINPKLKVKVIYHGFLAELSQNEFQKKAFNSMIESRKDGTIDLLGFAKKGLAESMNILCGLDCKEIIYFNPKPKSHEPYDNNLNVGVLVSNTFRKNFHNMAVAGLMNKSAVIHVTEKGDLDYLDYDNRINAHGFLDHNEFVALLGKMTVNLHTTFSEASGGQVCSESISQGVPCVSSYTSAFFDYDDELKEKLVVNGVDDSWHIYKKMEEVLNDRDYLSMRCLEYSEYLNSLANERLSSFLNA